MTTKRVPVIALCNQKGGVGKTTTYHLARAACQAGVRVLVVDMDPQGNVTAALAPELGEDIEGVAHALSSECIDEFDLVLIDCPPSLDQLTVTALTAASGVVVVTAARLWSASGWVRLSETVAQVKAAYNRGLEHLGIIVNAMEATTRTRRHWHEELREAAESAGMRLFAPAIPKRTLIGDTAEASLGLDEQGAVGRELAEIYTGYLEELLAAREEGEGR
ncbi:MAG: ParA family protein [Actinomycetaceae bacterium]|nr:ParA family protein [Actinomycetaceae bacterium]